MFTQSDLFKTEIRFCSFRIWPICRQIPLAPDQCWPTIYGIVTCKCCIPVLYGPAIHRTRDPNIEGGGGRGEGKIVNPFSKLSGKDFF